ncbi:hypothetical protein, partial [Klebsiella pneumoniae]
MPGYVEAHTDEEGNLVLGIRDSGVVETPDLLTAEVNLKKTETPGWEIAWTDENGNIAMGIRDDGSVYPEPENNGIVEFTAAD